MNEDPTNRKYIFPTVIENKKIKIDYEHIVPQKRIENQLKDSNRNKKNYPISCLGNICYLSSTDNRSKKEKTLYEFAGDRPSFVLDNNYLKLIDYPDENELKFLDYNFSEFDKHYIDFISNRLNILIREIKQYLINE